MDALRWLLLARHRSRVEFKPDAATFVGYLDDVTAAANETGAGAGLSGSDLVLTQAGSIPGATGSPLGRAITAANQHFSCSQAFIENFILDDTFTFLWTLRNASAGSTRLCVLGNYGGSLPMIFIKDDTSGKLQFNLCDDSGYPGPLTTSAAYPTSGQFTVGLWSDGTFVRGGFTALSKPTKWSDFPSANRISMTRAWSMTPPLVWTYLHLIASNTGALYGTFERIVVSRNCLIDNAA